MAKHKTLAEMAEEVGPGQHGRLSWFAALPTDKQQELRDFRRKATELKWSKREAHDFVEKAWKLGVSGSTFNDWWKRDEEAERNAGGEGGSAVQD